MCNEPLPKIAHIITRLIVGGAQENTLLSVNGLQKTGKYDVWLMTGPEAGPEGSLMPPANGSCRVHVIPALRRDVHPLYDLIAFCQLCRVMRREKFTIVHTHSSKAGILGRLAARVSGVPVIVHTIHGLPFFPGQRAWRNWLFIRLERLAGRWTTCLIGVAPAMVAHARAAGIGTAGQFVTIYSGMDLSAFRVDTAQRLAMRRQLGIAPDALVIGKIARLFPLKGHEFLLQAVAGMKSLLPRVTVVLVGDGILRHDLEAQAQNLGVSGQVRFIGLVHPRDIPRYLAVFDVLAHVSLREGLPRAVVQAAAAGIPAVCFSVDGAVDIISDGVNGFLVPPKDIDALQARLTELLKDPIRRQAMGAAAQAGVSNMFSGDRMIAQLNGLYGRLLGNREGKA